MFRCADDFGTVDDRHAIVKYSGSLPGKSSFQN